MNSETTGQFSLVAVATSEEMLGTSAETQQPTAEANVAQDYLDHTKQIVSEEELFYSNDFSYIDGINRNEQIEALLDDQVEEQKSILNRGSDVHGQDSEDVYEPFGYELLSQNEDENLIEDHEREMGQEEEEEDYSNITPVPPILTILENPEAKIPKDDLEAINAIMKNITIPEYAVPEWALQIPEESWLPVFIADQKNLESRDGE
ncbi:hypothetical protein G9A89_013775 [Geosiphon pyriformis]|nr:hypothetical protein G9A89_013775 [Geosiphon pyriformis]